MRVLLLVCAVAALARGAAAVKCGSLGDIPLSGCKACTVTSEKSYETAAVENAGRNLLAAQHGKGPKPSCTECDTAAGYQWYNKALLWGDAGKGKVWGKCGCKDGLGVTVTGTKDVSWNGMVKPMRQFKCAKCGAGQVPLTDKSGLSVALKDGKSWTVVLKDKADTKPLMAKWHGGPKGEKGSGAASRPSIEYGSCVACVAGTKADKAGVACVKA